MELREELQTDERVGALSPTSEQKGLPGALFGQDLHETDPATLR